MNNKRKFIKGLAAMGAVILGSKATFAATKNVKKKKQGKFMHVVFIWLKEPDNESHRKTFIDNTNAFMKEIDEVNSWYIGEPAKTPRDIVDNSYTFSLIVNFDNRENHDIYQEHEAHKKFVTDTSKLWNKVQVYDSLKA